MHQKLQTLIRHLQNEKCPPAVHDAVARRIARQQTPARSWRPALAWTAAAAACAITLAFWQMHARRTAEIQRAQVVQQTHDAFAVIGRALIHAAGQAESALLKEAVPPLREGYQNAKDKVTKPI